MVLLSLAKDGTGLAQWAVDLVLPLCVYNAVYARARRPSSRPTSHSRPRERVVLRQRPAVCRPRHEGRPRQRVELESRRDDPVGVAVEQLDHAGRAEPLGEEQRLVLAVDPVQLVVGVADVGEQHVRGGGASDP